MKRFGEHFWAKPENASLTWPEPSFQVRTGPILHFLKPEKCKTEAKFQNLQRKQEESQEKNTCIWAVSNAFKGTCTFRQLEDSVWADELVFALFRLWKVQKQSQTTKSQEFFVHLGCHCFKRELPSVWADELVFALFRLWKVQKQAQTAESQEKKLVHLGCQQCFEKGIVVSGT